MKGPWRQRDFRLLWAGGLINDTGDWLLIVALPLYVLVETGSGAMTALLFVAQLGPAAVLGPLSGNLVDRWDLRRTVVITNVAQAVAVLPLLLVTSERVWPAFLVAVSQSVLTVFNNSATASLLVRVVPSDHLTSANSARAMSENIARLVGSPLGGIVVGVAGLHGVVLVDGLTFLVVAGATAAVRSDARPLSRGVHDHHARSGTMDGLRHLRRTRPLTALVTTLGLAQISQGMFLVLFIAFVTRRLGGSEADVGIIRGFQAVGGIAGGLVVASIGARVRPHRLIGLGFAGMAVWGFVSWNLPPVTTAIWVYAALMAAAGPAAVSCSVGLTSAAQQFTPPAYLGLLVGTSEAAAAIGQAIGAVAAGVLLDRVDLTWLLNGQSTLYVVTAVVGFVTVRAARASPRMGGPDRAEDSGRPVVGDRLDPRPVT